MVRKDGVISIYLILIFVCIASLILSLFESTRIDGSRFFLQQAADSAVDSLFSNYDRDVWETYNILLLNENNDKGKGIYDEYLNNYLDNSGIYRLGMPDTKVEEKIYITDYGGKYLEKEILDYMKYAAVDISYDSEDIWKRMKEAEAIKEIGKEYTENSIDISYIEKMLISIKNSLNKLHDLLDKAIASADEEDEEDSLEYLYDMYKMINIILGNITKYKKASSNLVKEIEKNKLNKSWDELSEQTKQDWERNLDVYNLYVKENSVRIENIEKLERELEELKYSLQNPDWSSQEDEESPDFYGFISNIHIPEFNLEISNRDTEKENDLHRVYRFFDREPIKLVLPKNKTLSTNTIKNETLDSNVSYGAAHMGNISIVDRLLINEYITRFFADFTDNKEYALNYELEYLVSGEKSDVKNLNNTLFRILAIRQGMNLIHIFNDKAKLEVVNTIAGAISGLVGLPSLSGITAFFIINTWALIESVIDLRGLLEGKRVPVLKEGSDWKTDLNDILSMQNEELDKLTEKGERGFSYEDYLRIFLLNISREKLNYRMLNLIQDNLYDKINIKNMIYGIKIQTECTSERIFSHLMAVFGNNLSNTYKLNVSTVKSY